MSKYERGMEILNERFANKDNVISLATISLEKNADGAPVPSLRDVDAYYEDGCFYCVTYGLSNKMQQVAKNREVAFSVHFEWFSGNGYAENLGWVMEQQNAELRTKLRKTFAEWYDQANNEDDKNCCILKIQCINGVIIVDHGVEIYRMDFANKKELSK